MFCIKEERNGRRKSHLEEMCFKVRDSLSSLPPQSCLPLCFSLLVLLEVLISLSTYGVENPRADFAVAFVHNGFLQSLGNTSSWKIQHGVRPE